MCTKIRLSPRRFMGKRNEKRESASRFVNAAIDIRADPQRDKLEEGE